MSEDAGQYGNINLTEDQAERLCEAVERSMSILLAGCGDTNRITSLFAGVVHATSNRLGSPIVIKGTHSEDESPIMIACFVQRCGTVTRAAGQVEGTEVH